MNTTLLQKLESFQAELTKRILRIPTYTSNNTARMALQWPSMQTRILIIKLLKVVRSDLSLSARVFRSLAASDVESLVIIRQCRFSSRKKFCNLTCPYYIRTDASTQQYVQAITSSSDRSWLKLWDMALGRGVFGTTCILRFLSLHCS